MNTKAILKGVEKLHHQARATKTMTVKADNRKFTLVFNGHAFDCFNEDNELEFTWNTRKITVARKWLKDWFLN